MNIIGISAFHYDSAACLLRDGEVIAAAQEERFSRRKHDPAFPLNSIRYCLKEGALGINDLDFIAFYSAAFIDKLKASYYLRRAGYFKRILFFRQKESYLASAFYPSAFSEAAILVNDSRQGILFGRGQAGKIEHIKNDSFNFSPGAFYSAITAYLGFKPCSDEYKVMGLAAYGKPKYAGLFLDKIRGLNQGKLKKLLGGISYKPAEAVRQEQMDIASSAQSALESQVLKITEGLHRISPLKNLCISGDLGLNCLLNTAVLKQGIFKNLWIQPAASDAGCAMGVSFLAWHKYLRKQRLVTDNQDKMKNAYLGPAYTDEEIEEFLVSNKIPYEKLEYSKIPQVVAALLAEGNIVGWFQGRMEFGPRALGARSILADSRNMDFRDRLNLRVKFRENFRPFAPTVLADKAHDYFDLPVESPYMLFTSPVREGRRKEIPAAVHIDNSSRLQTLKREQNPLYYDTIYEFYKITGCPAVVNTSFNAMGRPVALNPQEAYKYFKTTEMDFLILGRFLLDKKNTIINILQEEQFGAK